MASSAFASGPGSLTGAVSSRLVPGGRGADWANPVQPKSNPEIVSLRSAALKAPLFTAREFPISFILPLHSLFLLLDAQVPVAKAPLPASSPCAKAHFA